MSENVWGTLEEHIEKREAHQTDDDIWECLADRLNRAKFRPRQAANCELQHHVTHSGIEYYVLANPAGVYLKLTPPQAFIWKALDGEHTVRDIILAYMIQYRELAVEGISQTLDTLLRNGFLEQPSVDAFARLESRFQNANWIMRLPLKLLARFFNTTFSFHWVDSAYQWLYRNGGKLLFTLPVQLAFAVITVLGIGALVYLLSTRDYDVFTTNDSLSLGVLTLYISMGLVAIFHESGHALTCIHYGRKVHKGGVMIYLGMLAFFIDTTDIWMAPRRARIAVSWAGPYTNLFCSGVLSILIAFFPGWGLAEVLFKAAAMSTLLAIMNLNPLLMLDGYFILMDVVEIPNLRNKAFGFLSKHLLPPSRRWLSLTRHEKILVAYGLFAGLYTGAMIVLGLRGLTLTAYDHLNDLVGPSWGRIILLLLGGLVLWSIFYTLGRKPVGSLISKLRNRRSQASAALHPGGDKT